MDTKKRPGSIRIALAIAALAVLVRWGVEILYVQAFDGPESISHCTCGQHPEQHAMIKGDEGKYFRTARLLIDQLESGENWLVAGPHNEFSFLFPRLVTIYGLLSGKVRYDSDGVPATGQVTGFLLAQALFFGLCLAAFYLAIERAASRGVAVAASLFLALEPSYVQYAAHLSTETIFFGLECLAIASWLAIRRGEAQRAPARNAVLWFSFGLLLGVLFLQRPVAILFPAVFLAARFFPILSSVRSALLSAGLVLAGFAAILAGLGFHNLARCGFFYISPYQGGTAPLKYGANQVHAYMEGIEESDAARRLMDEAKTAAVAEGVYDGDDSWTEREHVDFGRLCQRRAMRFFFDHPRATLVIFARNIIYSLTSNPMATWEQFSQTYTPEDKALAARQLVRAKRWQWAKVVYTILLVGPVAIGFTLAIRKGRHPLGLVLLMTLAMLYYPALCGWFKHRRLILPNFVFYSVFWGEFAVWALARLAKKRRPVT